MKRVAGGLPGSGGSWTPLRALPIALALLGAAAATRGSAASAAPVGYLEDARTARSAPLVSPRARLAECLAILSKAAGLTLTAATALADEPLVGAVQGRPLRETMQALEALFDARWTPSGSGYVLAPDPVTARAVAASRAQLIARHRKQLDEAAAEAVRRKGEPLPPVETALRDRFPPLAWSVLPSADRDRVLRGESVTVAVPEAQAAHLYAVVLPMSGMQPGRLTSPLLVTVDLDDRGPAGLGGGAGESQDILRPALRTRATGMRENSIVGGIHTWDFLRAEGEPPPAPPPPAEGPLLPPGTGRDGHLYGTRDDVVIQLARAASVPILSRHRPMGGTFAVQAAGRPLSQVLAEVAAGCIATVHATPRGYQLLRSRSEALDQSAVPNPAILDAYLKSRPAPGKVVSLAVLSQLGQLTPLQLSYLARSNRCSDEAEEARELYAVLRFYRLLTPDQRAAAQSVQGVPASALSHAQLHALLDDKLKRGNWEVHSHLQQLRGLHFRIFEEGERAEESLTLLALRGGVELSRVVRDRPVVGPEDRPAP